MTKRSRADPHYTKYGTTFDSVEVQMQHAHYTVLRGFLPPREGVAERLRTLVQERSRLLKIVFNATASANDNKRLQVPVGPNEWPVEFATFFALFRSSTEALMPGRVCDDMVVLLSEQGCLEQAAHADWTAASLEAVRTDDGLFGGYPAGALLALEPGTALNVWPASSCRTEAGVPHEDTPPTRVALDPGDLIVFRADLVHAGCAYMEAPNVRLHVYCDRRGVKRGRNETFTMM